MEFLGIGVLELLFILVIILLVAGPKDIAKTSRNLGKALNKLYRSPSYHAIRRASDELRHLPQRLAKEAQLEELAEMTDLEGLKRELKDSANTIGTELKQSAQAVNQDLKSAAKAVESQANQPYQAWVAKQKGPPAADTKANQPYQAWVPRQDTPADNDAPGPVSSGPPPGVPRPATTAHLRAAAAQSTPPSAATPPHPTETAAGESDTLPAGQNAKTGEQEE